MPGVEKGSVVEFVIWIIVIVLVVAVIAWLVNRRNTGRDGNMSTSSSASEGRPAGERESPAGAMSSGNLASPSAEAAATAGLPGTAGYGAGPHFAPPVTPDEEHDAAVAYSAGAGNAPAKNAGRPDGTSSTPGADAERSVGEGDVDDWTTGTEAGPAAGTPGSTAPGEVSPAAAPDRQLQSEPDPAEASSLEMAPPEAPTARDASTTDAATTGEYTEEDRGSERRAAEARAQDQAEWESQWSDAEGNPTPPPFHADGQGSPQVSAAPQTASTAADTPGEASKSPAAVGHRAAGHPYGEGSASPEPDGSGPAGYSVKGDASTMVYYDETDAGYGDAACDVWFLSPAHAEAAGFRGPRRIRR